MNLLTTFYANWTGLRLFRMFPFGPDLTLTVCEKIAREAPDPEAGVSPIVTSSLSVLSSAVLHRLERDALSIGAVIIAASAFRPMRKL